MKIILMAGFKKENVVSINNISNYIKKTYNVKYIYHATTKKGVYTKNILYDTLTSPTVPTIRPIKSLNVNYKLFGEKIILTDVDMWDRTDTYKNTINKMRNDTDEQLETRMRSIYNNILTQHLDMSNLNDDIKKSNYDVVIIADELAISSLVENLYKINKYYSFRNIGCYISVINTKTKLLDMHKFHI